MASSTTERTLLTSSPDMSPAYIAGVQAHFPNARIVFDLFHIMKLAGEAPDAVRKNLRAPGADAHNSSRARRPLLNLRDRFESATPCWETFSPFAADCIFAESSLTHDGLRSRLRVLRVCKLSHQAAAYFRQMYALGAPNYRNSQQWQSIRMSLGLQSHCCDPLKCSPR